MSIRIGVGIPCYKGHIPALKYLLDSIQNQTRKPDSVVVSCSSSELTDIPPNYYEYSFPLEIITCPDRKNAAQNRNITISKLNTDVISFIDADDIMHPQRIEIIERCFLFPDINLLLHSFEMNPENDFEYYELFPFDLNMLFICQWRSIQHNHYPYQDGIIHNSQMSVRKHVFDQVKFREENEYFGKEDTLFNGDVIHTFPNSNAYSPLRLSKYVPSRSFTN